MGRHLRRFLLLGLLVVSRPLLSQADVSQPDEVVPPVAEELAGEPAEPPPDPDGLVARHRAWLDSVQLLITDQERAFFLELDADFRRDAFIEEFWRRRDPLDDSRLNELRVDWEERAEVVLEKYESFDDARAEVFLLNGPPLGSCVAFSRALEVWWYEENEHTEANIVLLFERRSPRLPYTIWEPPGIPLGILRPKPGWATVHDVCKEEMIGAAMQFAGRRDFYTLLSDYRKKPEPPSSEWVSTFRTRSAYLPADVETFDVGLALEFPGRHQQRTVMQGLVTVPREEAGVFGGEPGEAGGEPAPGAVHQFLLTGDVVHEGELFETFRYRFEVPVEAGSADPIPLVFQRYLRPGTFELVLKLEDVPARRFAHLERTVEVPPADADAPRDLARSLADTELFRFLSEADAATARGERSLRLVPPPGVVHTGMVRFQTLSVGDLDEVVFFLDDQPILTKRSPPYSVELDLGATPSVHRLRASAFAAGEEVAADELVLNPGGQRFRVRLTEPRADKTYRGSVRAVVQVIAPEGETLDRVELFRDEERVATLYQEPYVQPIALDGDRLAYIRAVAYLADGNSTEDLVFVNAPDFVEEIEVQLVELYATVVDAQGRPVLGLGGDAFKVFEDGQLQIVRRFEYMDDLPIHAGLLIDVSASMEESLGDVGEAARAFVEQAITPRDRATVIAFNELPQVEVRFTNDLPSLTGALLGLRAEGGTALYDSLVFALHYFHGVKGQKALLVLSDGKDESSRFDVDTTLEYARRAGVTVYAIGLSEALERGSRKVLQALADETGGRAFFIDDLAELPSIYAAIEEELRSQYLLTYQSSSTRDPSRFRRIEVAVEGDRDLEVRAMSGYYP